jgi:hypothetical protein
MQFSNFIQIGSLLVATGTAFAGDPDAGIPVLGTVIESDHLYPWEKQRIRATEAVESGAALKAFNYLQDQLGKPMSTRFGMISIQIFTIGVVPRPGTGWQ